MNFKQKLGYMFIGSLFTLTGYILASLGGDTTHAQQDEQVIDKIVCRELEVVNKEGKEVVHIRAAVNGGLVNIYNNKEKRIANIGAERHMQGDGMVGVWNKEGNPVGTLYANIDGSGIIDIRNKYGHIIAILGASVSKGKVILELFNNEKLGVGMAATESGGIVSVRNNEGISVVNLEGKLSGEGLVHVSDKEGDSIIVLEPNTNRTGGVVEVYGKEAKGYARIGATPDGGFMVVGDNARKDVVFIRATPNGGFIQTYKGGWRTH
ncbi:hypothetical protein C6497_07185 [Candidatus Poribacteria bacterium]|nr:MAG: hypothetical protein C6497_07185 [Candidatus Poribacteria bacterium]